MDLLVVGSGLSGAIIAHQFAQKNYKVIIIEKKAHIAGHTYDQEIAGIMCHMYGPHIFHTSQERVFNFMQQFWKLNKFKNEVLCDIDGRKIPLPFNFTGIETFFPHESHQIKQLLIDKYGLNKRVTILDLQKFDHPLIQKMVNFVYQNIFKNYTTKMWGIDPEEINPLVLKRVPINIGYSRRYFADKYEGIPETGYTATIAKILDHPNIKVLLNTDAQNVLKIKNHQIYYDDKLVTCPVIYTGPVDELFAYRFGVLEYRSLDIQFQTLNLDKFQPSAVVNYPAHPTMTRITEYKHMTFSPIKNKTVISYEYPGTFALDSKKFGTPYYPMMTEMAKTAYQKYAQAAAKVDNLHLIGRLATFKYINMDEAIALALDKATSLLETLNSTKSTIKKDNK